MKSKESTDPAASQARLARVLLPVAIIVAVVWAGALTIQWLGSTKSATKAAGGSAENASDPNAPFALRVGATLPPLHLHPLGGAEPRMLTEIPGKVFLINFWATWCEACMVEMPSLVRLRQSLKAQGFEIIGINLDEAPEEAVPPVAKKLAMEFPIFKDTDGELADLFGLSSIPLSVLVNAQGRVLWIEDGERDWNSTASHELIEKLIAGGAAWP
jgi:thiol-disulfide isomerase/thioredoxin